MIKEPGTYSFLAANGAIDIQEVRIINEKDDDGFTEKHSTALYPEWPFSKLQHTPLLLAEQVATLLMKMHKQGDIANHRQHNMWSIPLEYQPVHELLKDLRLPPYNTFGQFTLMDALKKYRYWILLDIIFICILLAMTMLVIRLNRELKISKQLLEQHHTLILNSVADGIYGVDLEGKSTFVNKAMERITGWRADRIIGKNQHELLDSVHRAFKMDCIKRGKNMMVEAINKKIESHTGREKEVLYAITSGKRNKTIANDLNISLSTVEAHRSNVMSKMEAESLSELMRMVLHVENNPDDAQ